MKQSKVINEKLCAFLFAEEKLDSGRGDPCPWVTWLVAPLPVADMSPLPGAVSPHHPGWAGGSRAESSHLSALHAGLWPHGAVRVRGARLQPRAVRAAAEILSSRLARRSFWSVTNMRLEFGCRRAENKASEVIAKNTDNLTSYYYPH